VGKKSANKKPDSSAANRGFEAKLWLTTDKLRNNMDSAMDKHVVRVLVERLAPYKGRVYDPCCGSAGMFVESETFVEEHRGRRCLTTTSFCYTETFAKLAGWSSRNSFSSTAPMPTSGVLANKRSPCLRLARLTQSPRST